MNVPEATAAAAPGVPVPAAAAATVRFVGERRAFWGLLVRGAVFLALTLGIYRFWLATDIRRFLWSNTEIAGDSLEYTGTALELLLGFLIAIALLVPIYVGLFLLALNLGTPGELISVLGFPLLAFLGHFAVYRARRYRLTRTVYRGIRCHQGGSALRYAVCAVVWWTLIILTLGLAYPFAQASLERFKLKNTHYGNLAGRFDASGFRLFLRGLPMWLLVIGPLAVALIVPLATVEWDKVFAAAAAASSIENFIGQLEGGLPAVYPAIVVAVTAVAISVAMAALLFPVFQAMMLRWWLSGLRLDGLTIASQLRTAPIYGAYLRFLWYGFLFVLAAGLVGIIVFLAFGTLVDSLAGGELAEIAWAAAAVAYYVAIMLGFSAIYQATVKLSLWRCGVESIALTGTAALDHVKAGGTPSSAVGEGLADALNVGGF
jgi:uncharacterized membrane protein YjgN (DUF898 family)